MAKAQKSFAEKAKKAAKAKAARKSVKVVESIVDPKTGALRFSTRMVAVPEDQEMTAYLNEQLTQQK